MEFVAMSYLKLYSTWTSTKKGCFFILVIVLLNAAICTHSVNQLLISWNMHGLPAGAQQGALVSRGCCSIRRRHPNYALLQIGSLCLQPSTLQQKLSHGITAQKFQTVKLYDQELHITSSVPSTFEPWWFWRPAATTLTQPPVLTGRCIPVMNWWTDLQAKVNPWPLLSFPLCGDGSRR